MKIGLYFGSFNPIHIGHLAIANYMVEFTDLNQLWFVVSPQNPLKKKSSLLEEYHRFELVNQAVDDDLRFKASNVEFKLPQPSYTTDTLAHLEERYPDSQFVLIMGSDNLDSIHKWKNYEQLLDNYQFYVYPRHESDIEKLKAFKNVKIVNAPQMELSATFIRNSIKEGKDIRHFLPPKVYNYIVDMHFYEK